MTYIEPIVRRKFLQRDRAAVQEQVCLSVEADPERFLTAYRLDSRSFEGRYVNSDLMKGMFLSTMRRQITEIDTICRFTTPQQCQLRRSSGRYC